MFLDFTPFEIYLNHSGIESSRAMIDRLLNETGVAMLPGEVFGRSPEELTARMAYVNFDGISALNESEKIPADQPLPDDFIHTWCSDTVEAMKKITEWLNNLR